MRWPHWMLELPLPMRSAVSGALVLGALGLAAGLVIGLRAYPPTAWAAAVEVGLPSALVGGVIGLAAGALRAFGIPRRPG